MSKKNKSLTSLLVTDVMSLLKALDEPVPTDLDAFAQATHTAGVIRKGNTPNAKLKRDIISEAADKLFEAHAAQVLLIAATPAVDEEVTA